MSNRCHFVLFGTCWFVMSDSFAVFRKIKLNNILRLPVFMDVKLPWILLAQKQESTGYNWL